MFTSIYYHTEAGRKPAKDFLNSCDSKTYAKFVTQKDRVEEHGTKLGPDHIEKITGPLYELKVVSELDVRVFCFFYYKNKYSDQHFMVFTDGLIKKTNKLPKAAIKTNLLRINDFMRRVEQGKIKLKKT